MNDPTRTAIVPFIAIREARPPVLGPRLAWMTKVRLVTRWFGVAPTINENSVPHTKCSQQLDGVKVHGCDRQPVSVRHVHVSFWVAVLPGISRNIVSEF